MFCVVGGIYATWLLWDCRVRRRANTRDAEKTTPPCGTKRRTRVERGDWWCQAVSASVFLIVAACLVGVICKHNVPRVAEQLGRDAELRATASVRGLPSIEAVKVVRDESQPDRPIVGIDLAFQPITDANIREFSEEADKIEFLILTETRVTDASLAYLPKMAHLTHLGLRKTAVTDTGCRHLAKITTLEDLSLSDTAITDAGLEHVKNLRNLRSLDIRNTAVTDAGLKSLETLQQLTELDVGDTAVTEQGLADLKAKLPSLKYAYGPSQR